MTNWLEEALSWCSVTIHLDDILISDKIKQVADRRCWELPDLDGFFVSSLLNTNRSSFHYNSIMNSFSCFYLSWCLIGPYLEPNHPEKDFSHPYIVTISKASTKA